MMEDFTLREFREERGVSVNDLSQFTGVHRNILYQWETGERRPLRMRQVQKLANFYQVSLDLMVQLLENTNKKEVA